MRPSLNQSRFLPESYEDFKKLLAGHNQSVITHCRVCAQPFSRANTRTGLAWAETQISGYCENCFDAMFADFEGANGN